MTPEQISESAGPAERRLIGLALNPAAPVDVLLRLLASESAAVRMALCRDRTLPDPVVDAVVAHPDGTTRGFFAENPYADPEQRARLVDDPEYRVRGRLAREPWADDVCMPRPLPDRTVVRIIETYEDDLLWELNRLISPGLRRAMPTHASAKVRHMGADAWRSLTPRELAALVADPDPDVQKAAAANSRSYARLRDPDAVREDLPAHPCHAHTHLLMYGALAPDVVAEALPRHAWLIARNASVPPETVALLAAHPDPKVRTRVAQRPDLGPAERRALAVDPDPEVRLALSVHPALTEEERAAIDYEVEQENSYCHYPVYDPELVPDLELVRAHALSAHPLLRRRAARELHLPADLVALLADDSDLGVRVLLGQNHPDAPATLLLRCFLEYTGCDRWHLTGHGNFPRAGLARFAGDEDPAVRRLALLDPEIHADTADRLTRDPDPQVRADAARHPRLPQERIAALLDDQEPAQWAAANPALPAATMYELIAEAGRPTP
ncbi:hypothetical protein [Streptomyces sp. NBC_01022]|uniref:hypothetical protein n=1 Tax=Streptomyces sp. NBC_01022 TaxID=2903723 RepID=UPI002DDB73B4|nr:hypothetical protein [Streptomyces sp. NBC_01022]WRZ82428.1 hypothetical protein OG316_20285 [Streptomyces sp. NBC_01022]